jgi:hypothetical protein
MQIAIIDNGQVIKLGYYKSLFPNVSFPTTGPDAEFLQANSALEVTVWKPTTATQKLVASEPYVEGNFVYTVRVEDKTAEELAAETASVEAKKDAQTVSMKQARIALSRQGLLDDVTAALSLIEGQVGEEARIAWEFATEVKRGDKVLKSVAYALSWDESKLDELFELATTI